MYEDLQTTGDIESLGDRRKRITYPPLKSPRSISDYSSNQEANSQHRSIPQQSDENQILTVLDFFKQDAFLPFQFFAIPARF